MTGIITLNNWSSVIAGILRGAIENQEAKDRKLTEYMLIGTLLNFGIAIVSGSGYQYIIGLLTQ